MTVRFNDEFWSMRQAEVNDDGVWLQNHTLPSNSEKQNLRKKLNTDFSPYE